MDDVININKVSATLLIECENHRCITVLDKAQKYHPIDSFRTRRQSKVNVVIRLYSPKEEIMDLGEEIYKLSGVKSIKYRISN